jgi:hypothetical protein
MAAVRFEADLGVGLKFSSVKDFTVAAFQSVTFVRSPIPLRVSALLAVAAALLCAVNSWPAGKATETPQGIYSADPHDSWNRIFFLLRWQLEPALLPAAELSGGPAIYV